MGYARVSTDDQKMDMQINALKSAGCRHTYIQIGGISGATPERPGLQRG
ncbi:recombinase family protein [Falsochrobactrum shanghaiense]|nr:recombinase family protein [Falsochrobactrum shanghaiense]